jgi:hypothetical protein
MYNQAWVRKLERGELEGQLGSYAIQSIKKRLEYDTQRTATRTADCGDGIDAGVGWAKISKAQSSSPFRVAMAPL